MKLLGPRKDEARGPPKCAVAQALPGLSARPQRLTACLNLRPTKAASASGVAVVNWVPNTALRSTTLLKGCGGDSTTAEDSHHLRASEAILFDSWP